MLINIILLLLRLHAGNAWGALTRDEACIRKILIFICKFQSKSCLTFSKLRNIYPFHEALTTVICNLQEAAQLSLEIC